MSDAWAEVERLQAKVARIQLAFTHTYATFLRKGWHETSEQDREDVIEAFVEMRNSFENRP